MTPELRAAVADVGATFKRCLALVRLYHPDHDAVRDLAVSAGAKLRAAAALCAPDPIVFGVEARSLSFAGKPVLVDDGTESAVATLFVDGVGAVVVGGNVTDDAVVRFVRLWGRASDRRVPLPADQTFSTLAWESGLEGIVVVPQADAAGGRDDVVGADLEQQRALQTKQALTASLLATTPLPLPSTSAPLPAFASLVDDSVARFVGTALLALGSAAPAERAALLALVSGVLARTLAEPGTAAAPCPGLSVVGAALQKTVDAARALSPEQLAARPTLGKDLEAVCTCLAADEVRAALAAAAAVVDGAALVPVLRWLPKKQLGVLLGLCGLPRAKEALGKRLAELHVADHEWAGLAQQAGVAGVDVVFAAARGKGAAAAVAVVEAARGFANDADGDACFVGLLKQLRGPEVEAARTVLYAAMARPQSAGVAEDMLVRLKDAAVLPRIAARLNDEARPVEQRRLAALALTRFDDDEGAAADPARDGKAQLRHAFATVKNDEVKAAIASALATAKDQTARPLLEAVAKKLIVDRGLKKACEEAVKRLDGAAS